MGNHASIFNIQRYSLHDGPGIRTLVFFKGCPLHCLWCSNPEGISPDNQIKYVKSKCNGCGECLARCPHKAIVPDKERGFVVIQDACRRCGLCVEYCASKAKDWSGMRVSLDELLQKVRRDAIFYKSSGGGVTLGGGDPLLQYEFTAAFLRLCRENGINTALETEAYCRFEALQACAEYCDCIHIDLKAWDAQIHKRLTGVSNETILTNLRSFNQWVAARQHKPLFIIRMPMLPETNFRLGDMAGAAAFLRSLEQVAYVEILPFHNLGEHKYEQIGKPYALSGRDNLRSDDVATYGQALTEAGIKTKITDW